MPTVYLGERSAHSGNFSSKKNDFIVNAYTYKYPRPAVTTDCVIFSQLSLEASVLLIRRKHPPFQGHWAFPGGFLNMDEDAPTGALRELSEETTISGITLHQIGAFTKVDRDPRGRTISIAFWGVADPQQHRPQAADDAAEASWFPLKDLPPLAFDHQDILNEAIKQAVLL